MQRNIYREKFINNVIKSDAILNTQEFYICKHDSYIYVNEPIQNVDWQYKLV